MTQVTCLQNWNNTFRQQRFYIVLSCKKSKWRYQRSGLLQESVFIYTEDLVITLQDKHVNSLPIELNLEKALGKMVGYYEANALRLNPTKAQAIHLKKQTD